MISVVQKAKKDLATIFTLSFATIFLLMGQSKAFAQATTKWTSKLQESPKYTVFWSLDESEPIALNISKNACQIDKWGNITRCTKRISKRATYHLTEIDRNDRYVLFQLNSSNLRLSYDFETRTLKLLELSKDEQVQAVYILENRL